MRSTTWSVGALMLCALVLALSPSQTSAASLRVAPTTLELVAPSSSETINLSNDAKHAINVQIRVFRWIQKDGVESLVPSYDVVASPPATRLAPGADYVVRIVRISQRPIDGEESYRIVVDELPDPSRQRRGTVALIVRHLIPAFFRSPDASSPDVSWSLKKSKGGLVLTARNAGQARLRIADLTLANGSRTLVKRNGLLGYVLGGAVMSWPVAAATSSSAAQVTLKADSDLGPVHARVPVNGR
ncbi:molecular chaperone [Ensifer sp.]|jgi:fimbrial chaperone protein|uniref:fimbrial biogenesis chaperone n=1 Tax=Ensifer sp. TaxID=1872086 RepID=UPI002E152DF4|nr:molecular chaperone [Ensifer sp.]